MTRCAASTDWLLNNKISVPAICAAHRLLSDGNSRVKPGRTRRAGDDVSIVTEDNGIVVMKPPIGRDRIDRMLRDLTDWINERTETVAGKGDAMGRYAYAVAASGIAHLRYETIHRSTCVEGCSFSASRTV